ncbi:hypothetical protein GNQ08_20480 [Paenibacillus macerans]|uniref:Uncharacterized protein n=1 Tax=Paenibacillus macerans TaxID=44252 RepID=A0A6N8F210_PAEMA|nr:hypothetical protein [Paenibacillus macerans]MUG24748.1 hypothetical protein [Paenibacillus macerans]
MSDLAVKGWVFNPKLRNEVVRVYGKNSEGDEVIVRGIVSRIRGDEMEVETIKNGAIQRRHFDLAEFGEEGLKLAVYKESRMECSLPDSYFESDICNLCGELIPPGEAQIDEDENGVPITVHRECHSDFDEPEPTVRDAGERDPRELI